MKKNKVALLGTCGNSTWREFLLKNVNVPMFNPVVSDWTPECQEIEEYEKNIVCNIHFYCITKEMSGVYSVAEMVNSSYQKDKITIVQIVPEGFDTHQLKSLKATVELLNRNGAIAYIDSDINRAARILNNCFVNIFNY